MSLMALVARIDTQTPANIHIAKAAIARFQKDSVNGCLKLS